MTDEVRTVEELGRCFLDDGEFPITVEKRHYVQADGVIVSGALADLDAVRSWIDKHGRRGDRHQIVTTFYAEAARSLEKVL